MKVIKRNGSEVLYNQQKIKDAVSKANVEVSRVERLSQAQITAIANNVTKIIEQSSHAVSIEDIQNYVEKEIMAMRGYEVAQKYITYRYKRALARQSNTTDERILSIIGLENEEVKQENANKNPTINSTQRDYMAGEVSKDLTTRILLPQDIVDAHNNGLIHFHDADYYAQKMHNCFTGDTKFMTHKGAKRFDSFKDGESVFVRDMHNEIRKATVHIYGEQRVQKVTFKMLGKNKKKTVKCTPNHRWILEDKKVTTALKVGDVLFSNSYSHYEKWKVEKIEFKGIEKVYCVEEPITHSFTLEDGMVTGNCDLINLEDMLQNGTVISGTMIEKPHSFHTACNITTQVIAQVASSQFGGQSFSLAHLVPFVDISRKKIKKEILEENLINKIVESDEIINKKVEFRLKEEIKRGIQTIQYQILTLMTTNGQAPFVTMFLWLDEVEEGQARDDMAMLVEEVLNQRIQGVKNEKGVYITPAFPKVIYLLDEDNIHEDSKYYYLTELAAKCTAKRMVPDYISGKVMRELKEGDIYPCMGCVDGAEVVTYKYLDNVYVESFERMWNRLSNYFKVELQPNKKDFVMKTPGVKIYDHQSGYVDNYGIIKNHTNRWLQISFSNGRVLTCTPDHPFETTDKRIIMAKDLTPNDMINIDTLSNYSSNNLISMKENRAWLYGFALCDSTYYDNFTASIAENSENEIKEFFTNMLLSEYKLETKCIYRNRGEKGKYIDLRAVSNNDNSLMNLKLDFIKAFEGKAKKDRHIPNEVFSWQNSAKLAFLAGMIDADGYLNSSMRLTKIQLGSTNKELAIQQALLAQTCGMPSRIYLNHYKSNCRDMIRYRVEFIPSIDLLKYIKCEKKYSLKDSTIARKNSSISDNDFVTITSVDELEKAGFSYDVTTESEHFTVSGLYSHNCRSFLTVDRTKENLGNAKNYNPNKHKYYGRFNQGVVTINLVDVACSSYGDMNKFWEILDERLELCHRALKERHKRLLGTPSDVAPILWQHGALARLEKGEKIDKLLYDGYSTISLGYAGLYEMCMRMTEKSHTDPEAKPFALAVMQKLNDKCNEWKEKENIDYSLYGTPMESTTFKFARCLQRRFGIIKDVTDHDYITNSYHVNVRENIDAFTKLSFESEFQKLSPGGAISYVEVPNMQDNIPAVLAVLKHIYNNIMYAELNTKSDYCQVCGYEGEIQIVRDKHKKLIWKCPNCGNTDHNKMNTARRTCGYIGTNDFNQGVT